jgi:hypothetical protein
MQMTVVNQKTQWIRSACTESAAGSHGMKRATAVAKAAESTAMTRSRRRGPVRIEARDYFKFRRACHNVRTGTSPVSPIGPPTFAS